MVKNNNIFKNFSEAVEYWWIQSIETSLMGAKLVSNYTSSLVTAICLIDGLSSFYTGKDADKDTFKKFIVKFMPKYCKYWELIRKLRNSIVHQLTIDRPETGKKEALYVYFSEQPNTTHLNRVFPYAKIKCYALHAPIFIQDVIKAAKNYLNELKVNENLQKKFNKRVNVIGKTLILGFSTFDY